MYNLAHFGSPMTTMNYALPEARIASLLSSRSHNTELAMPAQHN